MSYVPPYLERFGLDNSADEAMLKRAYARELKLINQELNPEGFQSLREARDAAQYWLAYHRDDEEDDGAGADDHADQTAAAAPHDAPAVPAAPALEADGFAPPAPAIEHPGAAGGLVFDEFAAAQARQPLEFMQIKELLERHLDDPRLLAIDAKEAFEQGVAELLADGWRPGHDALFEIAAAAFGWQEDRRRLQRMGYAGFMLDNTLRELSVFDQEKQHIQVLLQKVLRELRSSAEPGGRDPLKSVANAVHLQTRYPHITSIFASRANLENWRKRWPATTVRDSSFAPAAAAAAKEQSGVGRATPWLVFFVVMMLIRGLSSLSTPSVPAIPPPPSSQILQKNAQDLVNSGAGAGGPVNVSSARFEASDAVIAELVKESPDAGTCAQAVRIAQLRRLGSLYPAAAPGPQFDRYMVSCYRLGHWPMSGDLGQALGQALRRESTWAYPAAGTK